MRLNSGHHTLNVDTVRERWAAAAASGAESPAAAAGWSEGKPPRRARMGCVEAARLGARTRWQAALKTADPQTFLVAWSHGADDCAQPSISGPLISSCLLERYPLGRNRTRKLSNADFVLSVGEKRISGENRVRCCGTPILDKTLTSHPTKLGQGEAAMTAIAASVVARAKLLIVIAAAGGRGAWLVIVAMAQFHELRTF